MQSYDVNESLEYKRKYDSRGWDLSAPRKRYGESRFGKTLIKYVKLYCKYTKLAGFKYFVESGTTWFDRVLWFLLYAITVPIMIYTIYYGYMDVIDDPCLTNVETEHFPTQNLEFPGVSICTVNRISRRAALEMANEVFFYDEVAFLYDDSQILNDSLISFMANISRLTVDEVFDMIAQLGDLYESAIIPENYSYPIDELLMQFYNENGDITEIMRRLTPQCADVLVKCSFHSEERNCTEVFTFRKTQDGFCCTFNYATLGDDIPLNTGIDHRLNPRKVESLGETQGLSVILEPFLNDYFYTVMPVIGWKVMIFNPHDYPDVASGGVIEILLSPNIQMNVNMEGWMSYSTMNVLPYPINQRHCVFNKEMVSLRSSYTYSDCIVDCKIQDVLQTCECIPFFWPNRASRQVCSLKDVPCLTRHKFKWVSVIPHERYNNNPEKSGATNEGEILRCNHCYPVCNDVRYTAKMSNAGLASGHHSTQLMENVRLENHSVLHVYFSTFGTIKLKQDVLFRWYELLSDASSTAGIFIGFSLICILELAYFVWIFVCDLLRETPSSSVTEIEAEMKPRRVQPIYWGELYPSMRANVMTRRHGRNFDKY